MGGGSATESDVVSPAGILVTWRQLPRQGRVLLAGVFVNRLAGFLQIFLVLFLTHRGFTAGQAGVALGVYGAGAVLGTFTGGWLSDRISPRTATAISMLGYAAFLLSVLYFRDYSFVLLAVLTASASGQMYRPAAQTVLTEITPRERLVMVTAMYRLGLNLGTAVTPLIGAALVAVSYTLLFWVEALAAAGYALLALKALPAGTKHAERSGTASERSRPAYFEVLRDARYAAYLFAVLLLAAVYCQYTVTLPLAVVGSGLGLWWYGAVVSLNAIIVATCEVVATRFVQKWPLRLTALGGTGLLGVGYAIYAIGMVPAVLIAGTLVWTVSEIIGGPTVWSYPGMVAPAALRGRYFGAMQSAFGLGNALGPIVGVTIWTHAGRLTWIWIAAIAVLCTGAAQVGMRSPADKLPPAAEPTDTTHQTS